MVNLIAVLAAGIASMVIGFLWFGPLFGKIWMNMMGLKQSDMKKMKTGMQMGYVGQFVASLVMAWVMGMLITTTNATSLIAGLMVGFWGWLGFVATTTLGGVLWENKPVKLYLFNNAHLLLNALVMAAILVSLP